MKIPDQFVAWTPGSRHPETNVVVFKNVWSYDLVRRKIKARCAVCDFVISEDLAKRKEIVFECDPGKCLCTIPYQTGLKAHVVCDVCDGMYRALYVNWAMQDRNFFKNMDDEVKKLRGGDSRRRMGLE